MAFDLPGTLDAAAGEWNLDPAMWRAVSQVESGGRVGGPDSSAGAMGPVQVMPATAAEMGVTNPRDPTQQIYAGAKYFSQMLDRYGDPTLALAAYNAGPGRVDAFLSGKATLPAETQAYVAKVAGAYRSLGGGQGQVSGNVAAPPTPPMPAQGSGRPPGSYDVAAVDDGTRSDVAPSPLAPPTSTVPSVAPSAGPSTAADPFSQLISAAGVVAPAAGTPASVPAVSPPPATVAPSAPASPPASAPAPSVAPSAGDPFSDLMTAAGSASGTPPAAPAAGTVPTAPSTAPTAPATGAGGGILDTVRAGLATLGDAVKSATMGVANTAMRGAAFVDSKVPALADLDATTGLDPQAGTQRLDRSIAATDAAHPNSVLYTGGKLATDLAFALPTTAGLGGMLAAGADAAGIPALGGALASAPAAVRYGGALASNAAKGAAQSVTAAGLTAGSSTAPIGQQMKDAALTGAVLGGALPMAAGAARGVIGTALGGSITPEAAALAQTARDTYGIPLQAGQISSSPFVRFLSDQLSKLPFSGAGPASADQATAMTRAVASTFGEDASAITPAVMQAARTRLGNNFDSLAGQIGVRMDAPLVSDLDGIATRAQDVLTPDQQTVIGKQLQNLVGKMQQSGGTLPGEVYQNLIAKGGALSDAMNAGDPGVRLYAGQIRDALEDAMQRSAPPALAQQLAEARFQYKNLKSIEPLVAQAQGQDGNIAPLKLLQAVRNNFSDMAYTGAGPLGELASIGQRFLRPPPDSGTATRNMIIGGLSALSPAGLATAAHEPIGALGGALATMGTIAAGRAAGAYLRSPMLANRLIARGLAGNPAGSLFTNNLLSAVPQASALYGGALNPQQGLGYAGR